MHAHLSPLPRRSAAAFTLVEVILAIVIALGILVVLLYFYQQATHLRSQAIEETERIAAARLVMDRITSELGAIRPKSSSSPALTGTSNSVEFIKADVPSFGIWAGAALGRTVLPQSDLKRVKYRLHSLDGTNVGGLLRSEEPVMLRPTLAPAGTGEENRPAAAADADLEGDTNALVSLAVAPVLAEIQFLQFRYWNGTNWVDSWGQTALPSGIEVSLGAEPSTNGLDLADYPADLFKRVIYLAASAAENSPAPVRSLDPALSPKEEAP